MANTPAEFAELLSGDNPAIATGPGSMKDFYEEISYGNFSVDGSAEGWYTADNNHDYYGANDASGNDQDPAELAREAVVKADSDVDFSNYDNVGDGSVDTVMIIHEGRGEEENRGDAGDLFTSGDAFDKSTTPAAFRYDGIESTFSL